MSVKRSVRPDSEWLRLITECRQSGLSDKAWCEQQDIPSSVIRSEKSGSQLILYSADENI